MASFLLTAATLLLGGLALASSPRQAGAADAPPHGTIVLASTTSVDNSGLLGDILPLFTRRTGIGVRVVAVGTGQALAIAARGDADLVLVHDPEAEAKFMAAGHGVRRREIAWNQFVIVGPPSDPARIAGTHDAVAAFRAIRRARARFVSRGDRSGTDAREKKLWHAAGLDPATFGDGWYKDIGAGMGAALNTAAAMQAYTLSDIGTWLSFGGRNALRVEVEGDPRLLNRYDVITLNPAEHAAAGQADARVLADWLASPQGQQAIAAYRVSGQTLFHPEADAKP